MVKIDYYNQRITISPRCSTNRGTAIPIQIILASRVPHLRHEISAVLPVGRGHGGKPGVRGDTCTAT